LLFFASREISRGGAQGGRSRDAVTEMMAPERRHPFRSQQQPQIIQNLFHQKYV